MGHRHHRGPAPDSRTARTLADEVVTRRTRHQAPGLVKLDDSLPGVVAHVRAYTRPGDLPSDVVGQDIAAAWLITEYREAAAVRTADLDRLGLIETARAAGMGPTALARLLGLGSRQALVSLETRLRARLDTRVGVPDPDALRAAEAAARVDARVADGGGPGVLGWALLAHRDRFPPDLEQECGYDADDLAEVLAAPGDPDLVPVLRLILRVLCRPPVRQELRGVLTTHAQLLAQLGVPHPAGS